MNVRPKLGWDFLAARLVSSKVSNDLIVCGLAKGFHCIVRCDSKLAKKKRVHRRSASFQRDRSGFLLTALSNARSNPATSTLSMRASNKAPT
jgi:hypothetical protein